jgi:DNA repair protein RecO (recombination protein O)
MLQKTSGIVLHTIKYSETSLIVKIYTQEFGFGSYIISGVRSKKSKNKAGLFQPLALVDIVVSGNERSALPRISEINIHQPYSHLPFDVIKSSIAIFINEILLHSFREPHPDEELFLFIRNSLLILDLDTASCANFHLGFMVQLSRFLGFPPQGEYTADTSVFDLQEGKFVNYLPHHPHYLHANSSIQLSELMRLSYSELSGLTLSKAERKQLLNALILFYQLHISSFGQIKSAAILEEIIAG